MDDTVPKEEQPPDFNKIDLSQLQGFSFGTQWTQDKSAPADRREPRPDREDRRSGDGPAERRDRRAFRKPQGGAESGPGAPRRGEAPADGPRRGEGQADPSRRGPARGDFPRRGGAPVERAPYDSPVFATTFYPDDATFDALVKTIRASCRTIELFEIARTLLGKLERFTVLLARRPAGSPGGTGEEPAAAPLFVAVPDGVPFETEEAAIAHVLDRHLGLFFDQVEAEVEPPKGNFQVVNRCGVTGELLGPPNYHRYSQIMQQHHAAKLGRMPFEAYRNRIESVRDPEVIAQWLEKMKKTTRYVAKGAPAPAAEPVPAAEPAPTFDSLEEARAHLLAKHRDRIVRAAPHARLAGRDLEQLPPGEARRAIEGALERQRRFPLDTANALRGRLRREHFTIFKKGAKGISYVCAVKRRFRVPGQVFSENIDALISFIEGHPLVKAGELPTAFLRISEDGAEAVGPTAEQKDKMARLHGDLLWLVHEGYVTEFIDGGLYAPPPLPEARKREAEREEHDPENFPERAPIAAEPEQPAPVAEPSPSGQEAPAAAAEPEAVPVAEPIPAAAHPESALAPEAPPPESKGE